MQTKYNIRRAEMTRSQSAIVRAMLTDKRQTLSNLIVSCVDCGEREYGKSGLTGYQYAKKLTQEYTELSVLFQIFPPDDMWEE